MRTLPTVIAALCLAACSLPATAGVVYNWVEIEGNPLLGGPIVGRIEVKDEVWKQGSSSFSFQGPSFFHRVPASGLGLLDFDLTSPAMDSVFLALTPCNELSVDDALGGCEENGFSPDELMIAWPINFGFDLQFGSLLSGRFDAVDVSDEAHFFGVDENPIISIGIGLATT